MDRCDYIPNFTSIFKEEFVSYIKFKRSNGYKYDRIKCDNLLRIDRFFNEINLQEKRIDQEIIDSWQQYCYSSKNCKRTQAEHFSRISCFCEYLRMTSHENVIQPKAHNLMYHSDFIPYIFSDNEIQRMFKIAKKNSLINKNYMTFYIMLSLYYCCGLRFSELHNLQIKDYIDSEKKIIINEGKNIVTREIPLSVSTYNLLNKYIKTNNYTDSKDYIFINIDNKRISAYMIRKYYKELLEKAKIPVRYDGKRQRLHDLRHTFCVNSLKQMEEKGFDLYTSTSVLSVYLGHKSITETEYYLRLVQEEAEKCQIKAKKYINGLYESKVIYGE